MKKLTAISMLAAVALTGCGSDRNYIDTDKKTQLEIREFQTREFAAPSEDQVLRAMIDAFQDEGYIIKNAVPTVGLVSASKEKDIEDVVASTMKVVLFGSETRYDKHLVEEITGNVTQTPGNGFKVRLVIQEKVLNNYGAPTTVGTIGDQKVYQRIFTKIDKSIFIKDQKI